VAGSGWGSGLAPLSRVVSQGLEEVLGLAFGLALLGAQVLEGADSAANFFWISREISGIGSSRYMGKVKPSVFAPRAQLISLRSFIS
jgi:hypothetical protein